MRRCRCDAESAVSRQVAGVSAWGQDASLLSHASYGATVGWQCLAVLVTLTAASVGGTLAGVLVSTVNPAKQHLGPHQLFDDGAFWTVRARRSSSVYPILLSPVQQVSCVSTRTHSQLCMTDASMVTIGKRKWTAPSVPIPPCNAVAS